MSSTPYTHQSHRDVIHTKHTHTSHPEMSSTPNIRTPVTQRCHPYQTYTHQSPRDVIHTKHTHTSHPEMSSTPNIHTPVSQRCHPHQTYTYQSPRDVIHTTRPNTNPEITIHQKYNHIILIIIHKKSNSPRIVHQGTLIYRGTLIYQGTFIYPVISGETGITVVRSARLVIERLGFESRTHASPGFPFHLLPQDH